MKLLLEQEHFLRENKMTFELLEVLQLIKQHYEVDGNAAMAKEYSLLYFTTKDEFINKSRLGKMDEAKLNIELEQTREKIQEMSYHQRIQSMALWSAVVIALLALTILAVLYVHYRKTKRTNRLLYERSVALLDEGKELRMVSAPVENLEKPVPAEPLQADLDLMEKITAVMETSPEVFVDTFNINRLADLVGAHNKPVSHAINICKRCNFNVLLNEYRIKEACHRLMDTDTYGSYSIEGIGNSVGFKSRSYFAAVFKDIVGMTPSAFQKIYREQGIVPNSFSNEQES
ncbi:MAG: helix-turn-helix transcriptional regulator [Bacteroidales bacterium]|nr:helix-turn-helix transcriptional regulator [Candidatus Sodaliphilus aphodohippi]